MHNQELGSRGQEVAEQYLRTKGYTIIGKNFRTRWGELDLIAKQNEQFVFVEVKTRTSTAYGMPEEAITATKQWHLILASQIYLSHFKKVNVPWRIDVIGLLATPSGGYVVRHIENAVRG